MVRIARVVVPVIPHDGMDSQGGVAARLRGLLRTNGIRAILLLMQGGDGSEGRYPNGARDRVF